MFKTISETHAYVGELLPQLPASDARVDVSICVPFTALGAAMAAKGESHLRAARRTCTRSRRARSPGEISARC